MERSLVNGSACSFRSTHLGSSTVEETIASATYYSLQDSDTYLLQESRMAAALLVTCGLEFRLPASRMGNKAFLERLEIGQNGRDQGFQRAPSDSCCLIILYT